MVMSLRLSLLFTLAIALVKSDDSPQRPNQVDLQSAESNSIIGVASVAGIASRNGRVSSLGGIQFYPGLDAPISFSHNDGAGYYYPITVTKEGDGTYASGSLQLYPGSVFVSSTARSEFPLNQPMSPNINKPLFKEFFIQPMPEFFERQRNGNPADPWFLKNMFPFNPQRSDAVENSWHYPSFNPFLNFWR